MTREEARKVAELYTAFADGKMLQYQGGDRQWRDTMESNLDFIGSPSLWRVKPTPREAWLIYVWVDDSFPTVRLDAASADAYLRAEKIVYPNAFIVHMIEKTQ